MGAARQFNTAMTGRYLRAIDFIKLHYCLSQRTDNAFWTDNADPVSIPEGLPGPPGDVAAPPAQRVRLPEPARELLQLISSTYLYGMGLQDRRRSARHVHGGLAQADFWRGCATRGCAPPPAYPTIAPCMTDVYTKGFSSKPDLAIAEAGEAPRR